MIDPTGKRMTRNAALDELRAIARRSNPKTHLLNYSPQEAEDVRLWETELQAEAGIRYWEGE